MSNIEKFRNRDCVDALALLNAMEKGYSQLANQFSDKEYMNAKEFFDRSFKALKRRSQFHVVDNARGEK
ncbi:MAG: hypothetical protein KJN72_12105 [Woeseia sp.]|nr:hypothetical protein [Woeseia sp.]